jgi:hypothetical protein
VQYDVDLAVRRDRLSPLCKPARADDEREIAGRWHRQRESSVRSPTPSAARDRSTRSPGPPPPTPRRRPRP